MKICCSERSPGFTLCSLRYNPEDSDEFRWREGNGHQTKGNTRGVVRPATPRPRNSKRPSLRVAKKAGETVRCVTPIQTHEHRCVNTQQQTHRRAAAGPRCASESNREHRLRHYTTLPLSQLHSDTLIQRCFFFLGGALSKSQRSGKEQRMRAENEEEVRGQRER